MDKYNVKLDSDTENRILNSAKHIFQTKGLSGARMQEIADEAGINKAMLHYYFRTKDKLFEAVFKEAAERFFPKIMELFNGELPLFEKIERFIDGYITLLNENCFMPSFLLNEINQNPERLKKFFSDQNIKPPQSFIQQIILAVEYGEIKPIDPRQLMMNIISLCIFPIVAKPIIETILNISEEQYQAIIEMRKKEVAKFIINAIKV